MEARQLLHRPQNQDAAVPQIQQGHGILLKLAQQQRAASFEGLLSHCLKGLAGHARKIHPLQRRGAAPHTLVDMSEQRSGKLARIHSPIDPAAHTICQAKGGEGMNDLGPRSAYNICYLLTSLNWQHNALARTIRPSST